MAKKFFVFPPLFFFLFLLLSSSLKRASADESLLIEHKSCSYNEKLNLHSCSQVEAKLKDLTISADLLKYRPDDQILTFSGNIFMRSPKTMIMAKRASLNRKTSIAVLHQATLFDRANQAIIKAEKIRRTNQEEFVIEKGSLSLCRPDSPAWEIKSDQIVYRLDDFAYSVNTALFFYQFPVFYSPFFSWPTADKRSKGFLVPSYSHLENSDKSKSYGYRLKIPYFLPFGQDHDLTIAADIIEKRGIGLDLDYRYAFEPGMAGQLKGWHLKERRRARTAETENLDEHDKLAPYPSRYSFSFDHRQNIPLNGSLFFHHRQNSDNEVNREYAESDVHNDYSFLTAASVIFPWDNGGFLVNYEEGARFLKQSIFNDGNNRSDYPAKMPSLNFFHRFNRIDNQPLSIGISGDWTNYHKHESWGGHLSRGRLDVSYPFSIGFLNILPRYEKNFHHYQIYRSANSRHPDQFSLNVERKKIELNFEFFRLFYNRDKQADRKLSFRPALIWEETDDVDQSLAYDPNGSKAPDFMLPVFSRRSLTLKWESVYRMKNRGFFKLDVSQVYDFNTGDDILNHPKNQETEPGDSRLPLRIKFSFSPNSKMEGNLFYRYDYREKRIIEAVANLSAFDDRLNLSYVSNGRAYREADDSYYPKAQIFNFSQELRLGESFELLLKGSWDRNRQEYAEDDENYSKIGRQFSDLSLSMTYRHDCYNITASYSEKIRYNMEGDFTREELEKTIMLNLDIPFISKNNKIGAKIPYQAEYKIN